MVAKLKEYKILRLIGKGNFGEVSLAQNRKSKRRFVLKKLLIVDVPERDKNNAQQEANLMARLKHPNVVTYKESFIEDDHLYIAMVYCEGGDLYHRLRAQKGVLLPENQIVEWAIQIALGVNYLHSHSILHRDLKTQNIFLTKNKIIKVGDLGIARVLRDKQDMATTLIGTPLYMSPELFSNEPYSYKSDVWSMGCCVYEMATLKRAFHGKDFNVLMYHVIRGDVEQIPDIYTAELNDVIQRMLMSEAEQRPTVHAVLKMPYIRSHIARFLRESQHTPADSGRKSSGTSADAEMMGSDQPPQHHGHSSAHSPLTDPSSPECCSDASTNSNPGSPVSTRVSQSSARRRRRRKFATSADTADTGSSSYLSPESSRRASATGTNRGSEEARERLRCPSPRSRPPAVLPVRAPSDHAPGAERVTSASAPRVHVTSSPASPTSPCISALAATPPLTADGNASAQQQCETMHDAMPSQSRRDNGDEGVAPRDIDATGTPSLVETPSGGSARSDGVTPAGTGTVRTSLASPGTGHASSVTPSRRNASERTKSAVRAKSGNTRARNNWRQNRDQKLTLERQRSNPSYTRAVPRKGPEPCVEADLRFQTDSSDSSDDDDVSEGSDDFNAYLGHLDDQMTVDGDGAADGGDGTTPMHAAEVDHTSSLSQGRATAATPTQQSDPLDDGAFAGASGQAPGTGSVPPSTPPGNGTVGDGNGAVVDVVTPLRRPTTAGLRHSCVKRTPLTGPVSTPLRGPLVDKAEMLRQLCIERLGEKHFLRALEVLSSNEPDRAADDLLAAELGAEAYNSSKMILRNAVMCEQALHNLNEIGKPKYVGC
eukprot:m.1241007 g.1241007  ORF g.1241007 m.1241007 type:complete len:827 (+) comp24674_c0_seq4:587-3067(+)